MKLNSEFEIVCFRDLSYEEMTVEIQYKKEQIAQINQDKGISEDKIMNQLEIEILTDYIEPNFTPKFLLDDFLFSLSEATKSL